MDRRSNKHTDKNYGAIYADRAIDKAVYDGLYAVFANGAYCAKAITDALKTLRSDRPRAFVTSAFYGVLDNNVRLERIISDLCEKAPDVQSSTVLKIGMYYIMYADMPDYAAVNRTVELSKQIGGVFGGFINAVLKKSIGYTPKFKSGIARFSYEHNAPEWLCRMLIDDYSETRAAALLDAKLPDKTHIRPINGRMSDEEFDDICVKNNCERTEYGCYVDKAAQDEFPRDAVTAQSLSSVYAVQAYVKDLKRGKALDLCAAPGGKSIYLAELGFDVTACDIYAHKIELIKNRAKKLGVKLSAVVNDATKRNENFVGAYDLVVADCPCSGTGTLKSKPDIMLKRKPSDLVDLCALQYKILDASAQYCKAGGTLCYSTCSVLKCENEGIKTKFLQNHPEYTLVDEVKLLPDKDKCDGFYIVRFKRIEQ